MCKWGTTTVVKLAHPMPVSGRTEVGVDACLAPLVQMLNDFGVHTTGCCCGHEQTAGDVLYEQDGQQHTLRISPPKGLDHMSTHKLALVIVRHLKGKRPHGEELADVADVQAILDGKSL